MRKAPISISATWPPEGRLGSCLTNTRPVSGSQASNHLSPLALRKSLSSETATAKFAPCSAQRAQCDPRGQGPQIQTEVLSKPAFATSTPIGQQCRRFAEGDTLSPGPAEPANQPGLDWIAADPEHDRDGRGRRLRCDPRRLAPAATIAAICCLTCFALV